MYIHLLKKKQKLAITSGKTEKINKLIQIIEKA